MFDESFVKTRESISDKRYKASDTEITYRTLNSWSEAGLLNEPSDREAGWRKFSLADICWVIILSELRKLGLSLEKLKILKDTVNSTRKKHIIPHFNSFIALSLTRDDVMLVIAPTGEGSLGLELDYKITKMLGLLPDTHIVANVSEFTGRIFNKSSIKKDFPITLTNKELGIIAQIRSNDRLENVSIDIRNKNINRVRFTNKSRNPEEYLNAVREMVSKGGYRDIVLKVEKNKVVCMEEHEKV
jgi:DNA-binding transcriptional MerR regulator